MKCALIRGSVSEKAHTDLIASPVLGAPCRTGCNQMARADNSVGSEYAKLRVRNMHRPAFAFAVAGFLAEQLRHHIFQIPALGDDMSMPPVGTRNIIVIPQIGACPNGDGLLPDVQMDKARYFPFRKKGGCSFFEFPDTLHLPVHPAKQFF
ncbi:hypothetical protein D3C76_301750 [compost metagenome]